MKEAILIDPSVFQIIILSFGVLLTIIQLLGRGSINNYVKSVKTEIVTLKEAIKDGNEKHEIRLNNHDIVIIEHEKRITQAGADIQNNGAQDLIKMDNIARGMDDLKNMAQNNSIELKDVKKDVMKELKDIDTKLVGFMLAQKH